MLCQFIIFSALLYWVYIMHFQFMIYLVQEEEKARLVKGLVSQDPEDIARAQQQLSDKD